MINRDNWKLVNQYLDYRGRVMQNNPQTVRRAWSALCHLLQWADETPFARIPSIYRTFPEFVLTNRNDNKTVPPSAAQMEKTLAFARDILGWLRYQSPTQYKSLTPSWVGSLRVRRSHNSKSKLVRRLFWTLEEVERVLDLPDTCLRVQRDKAALAFIYLSAARGAAFVTLPIRAIDIPSRKVYQLPEWGVQTKNSKAAITYLLPIPRLLEVVTTWDTFVRNSAVNGNVAWYTRLTYDGLDIRTDDEVTSRPATGRRSDLYQGLQDLCQRANIEWKSPHKIRHGHGVYGLKHAATMAEYKALSQNMMHDSVATTDKTYSILLDDEVGEIIGTFKP